MGDTGKLASASLSPNEPAEIAAAFGLGDVHEVSCLAAGLMNRNWRLSCDFGVVALKQILDVPVPWGGCTRRIVQKTVGFEFLSTPTF
ncbi:hypothetical protein [Streptomyces sp. WMMB303]|uniref:hypothetical protein n=1 Tax=Streptomyces sp. WMMB303 TaxID=3034154 RepID=UPI0023EBC022|nr:hypothetical protein [Streptomyces sp. WMMB303]MDF4249934.1 hypothetical protein [Streptomyces sp. WMMB303]